MLWSACMILSRRAGGLRGLRPPPPRGYGGSYSELHVCDRSMSGGDAMLAAAAKQNTLLVINHNRRWERVGRRLRIAVDSGQFGQLTAAEVVWPSGRMGVVGTHFIDHLLMLTGQRAVAVSGIVDTSPIVDCRGGSDGGGSADFIALQGETAIEDPGCFATLQMTGGLTCTVCAGNSLSGGAAIRLYGTLGNCEVSGGSITCTFFGDVSSTGKLVGEPRTEV